MDADNVWLQRFLDPVIANRRVAIAKEYRDLLIPIGDVSDVTPDNVAKCFFLDSLIALVVAKGELTSGGVVNRLRELIENDAGVEKQETR